VKNMFSRLLTMVVVLTTISFLLIGTGLQVILRQQLIAEKKADLTKAAESMERLVSAFSSAGSKEENWIRRIELSHVADIGGFSTIVSNQEGEEVLTVINRNSDAYTGSALSERIRNEANDSGLVFEHGDGDGLFSEAVYYVCIPMQCGNGEYILVFSANELISAQVANVSSYALGVALLVLLLDVAVTSFVARRETEPLKELAVAEKEFGHGDLSIRFKTDTGNSEEIQELSNAFNNMATSIEKSELRRQEFVANVGHELKTPMTTIAGFMDGMIDGTIPEEQHKHYMTIVSNEVRRLSRLVQSMLETARIQDQGISEEKKKKFDICELMARTLLSFEQKIKGKAIEVDVQMPEMGLSVWASEDTIAQVVYNLLDNAVKFCPAGGSLYLQVSSNGQKSTISIANTGPVIPPEELPLVFDRFHKTDKSRSVDKEGAGLGLYIVKTIITAHHEDITVTSRDGVTRFSFTLPVR